MSPSPYSLSLAWLLALSISQINLSISCRLVELLAHGSVKSTRRPIVEIEHAHLYVLLHVLDLQEALQADRTNQNAVKANQSSHHFLILEVDQ